jgi:hypothetical protein
MRNVGAGYAVGMKPASRDVQPGHPTLAEAVRRAVDAVDPTARNDGLADLERRFEDRDEPLSAIQPVLERTIAEERGKIDPQEEDGAIELAVAVITYLAYRRDEADEEREELLRLAIDAEFDGKPPETVSAWLAEEGIRL